MFVEKKENLKMKVYKCGANKPTYFSILVAMLRNKNMLDKTATKRLVVIVNKHDVWEELIIFLNADHCEFDKLDIT